MTYQEVLKQTEILTTDEQKSLLNYLFLKYLKSDDKEQYANLFHYKDKIEDTDDIYNSIDAICGSGKGLWKEDAQVYINKLREDDRKF